MSSTAARQVPTWEIAYLFPPQGNWTEEDYLALNENRILEFSDGFLEVLPMPTTSHQLLVAYLYQVLLEFVSPRRLGTVAFAPLRIRLWPGKFREPDVVFMLNASTHRIGEDFWDGADLVMEVLSKEKEDRRRDLQTKRREYARAGIQEYWIVDPKEERIIVLRLVSRRYVVHGEFHKGLTAESHLLRGFTVKVRQALSSTIRLGKRAFRKSKRTRR